MATSKKRTYTAAPSVPTASQERFALVIQVLSGALTMSEAARRAQMSRNHFQTLYHRSLGAMIEALSPGEPGRPAKPERERELEAEVTRLRRENSRLTENAEMTERLLGAVGEVLRGQPGVMKRERRSKPTTGKKEENDDDEPARLVAISELLRKRGLLAHRVAAIMGIPSSTLRRLCARRRKGTTRRKPLDPVVEQQIADHVRALRGLVGAESLRRTITGASRRQCADVKRRTLTAMERDRIADCERVEVTIPGIVRGFDAMHVGATRGRDFVLAAADACVPFRTSAVLVERYNARAVAMALARDFDTNGAPLVLRMDRASAHGAPEVTSLLDEYGVLVLHGPAHHPCFYGQLERQNREHRGWLGTRGILPLPFELEQMCHALNEQWRRPSLAWRTAAEVWHRRPTINIDRRALRDEVHELRNKLIRESSARLISDDLAERLAVQIVLSNHGWLRREQEARC